MESPHSESLEASLARLDHLDEAHLELARQMFEAFGGALYGMDLLAAGALNRSKAHIAGFRQLIGIRAVLTMPRSRSSSSRTRCIASVPEHPARDIAP
jgi:hypothetical protein